MAPQNLNWPLLPLPDAQGRLAFVSLERSVRQNIQVILRTKPGEQLMRPNYGGGLENMLYEQNNLTTRRRIQELITESLQLWEKRIFLDRVDVLPDDASKSTVKIDIAYRLKRTNLPQQLAVTMELEA